MAREAADGDRGGGRQAVMSPSGGRQKLVSRKALEAWAVCDCVTFSGDMCEQWQCDCGSNDLQFVCDRHVWQ